MRLSQLIKPDTMVARSISLERDFDDETTLERYFLTGKGIDIVRRLASGLNGQRVSAWSIVGPYGMGKSAFVNYLLSLCGPIGDSKSRLARKMTMEKDPSLLSRFEDSLKKRRVKGRGLFRVAAPASFEPVNRTLAKALLQALQRTGEEAADTSRIRTLALEFSTVSEHDIPETATLVEFYKSAANAFGAPVVLVVDEF